MLEMKKFSRKQKKKAKRKSEGEKDKKLEDCFKRSNIQREWRNHKIKIFQKKKSQENFTLKGSIKCPE